MRAGQFITKAQASAKLTGRKTFSRQLFECVLLFVKARLGPGFYYMAWMDRSEVPLRTVLGFASSRAYRLAVHRVNNPSYFKVSQHKAIEKAVLTTYGVPTPDLIAYVAKANGRSVNGKLVTTSVELASLIKGLEPKGKLCIKPANSWGGAGVRAFTVAADGSTIRDATSGDVNDTVAYLDSIFNNSPDGFILERYVKQDPFYAALNSKSVNSFRVVIWDRGDSSRPWLLALLRVGRGLAIVDNSSAGGAVFPVNTVSGRLESGRLSEGASLAESLDPESIELEAALVGVAPPQFERVVDVALRAVRAFPGIQFAGVDVAVSVDGPVVLELNVWPDYMGFAHCQLPSKAAFTELS